MTTRYLPPWFSCSCPRPVLALAVDLASPFIWAGAVVIVGAVVWVLQAATKTGIGGVVKDELKPLHKAIERLETMIQSIDDDLTDSDRNHSREHERIWDAIRDMLHHQ